MSYVAEHEHVQVEHPELGCEREHNLQRESHRFLSGLDSIQVPAAQTGAALEFVLGEATCMPGDDEIVDDPFAHVVPSAGSLRSSLHPRTLVTDSRQDKADGCSAAAICKSCEEKAASTACVYPLMREGKRTVCGRVLCEDCKVLIPGEGYYCRGHALASRKTA